MAINKPQDFDTAQAWGDYNPLQPGGYICTIVNARETMSKAGNQMIELMVDISEGDEAGRFMNEYNNSTREPRKWNNSAVIRQLILTKEGTTNGGFKNLINVLEENSGSRVVWGDALVPWMKGKSLGLIFYREQWRNDQGEVKWATRIYRGYKTLAQMMNGDFTVPEDVYLKDEPQSFASSTPSGFAALDEDIPF